MNTITDLEQAAPPTAVDGDTAIISLDLIVPNPLNLRRKVEGIKDLAASMAALGQQTPILVQPHPDEPGQFLLIAGHRRLAAARALKWPEIEARVRSTVIEAAEQIAVMIAENEERASLTVTEVASGYQQMLDLGLTRREIAKTCGVPEKRVRAHLGVLRSASPEEQAAIDAAQVTVDDLMALAEFEKFPDLYRDVALTLGTPNFAGHLEHYRDVRARRVATDLWRKQAAKEYAPCVVLDQLERAEAFGKRLYLSYLMGDGRLGDLAREDREKIEATMKFQRWAGLDAINAWHQKSGCPHQAIYVSDNWSVGDIEVYCLDPTFHAVDVDEAAPGGEDATAGPVAAKGAAAPSTAANGDDVDAEDVEVDEAANEAAFAASEAEAAARAAALTLVHDEAAYRVARFMTYVRRAPAGEAHERMRERMVREYRANPQSSTSRLLARMLATVAADEIEAALEALTIDQLARLRDLSKEVAITVTTLSEWEARSSWTPAMLTDLQKFGYAPTAAFSDLLQEVRRAGAGAGQVGS